jgi:hypothetical protein
MQTGKALLGFRALADAVSSAKLTVTVSPGSAQPQTLMGLSRCSIMLL